MNPELTGIIFPVAAIVITLIAVGGLWLWWTSSDESAGEDASAEVMRHEASPVPGVSMTASASGSGALPHAAPRPVYDEGVVEAMRILRDLADGSLLVEIDGVRYRALQEMTDPKVGRRFLGNANALAKFARVGEIKVPGSWEDEMLPSISVEPPAKQQEKASAPEPPSELLQESRPRASGKDLDDILPKRIKSSDFPDLDTTPIARRSIGLLKRDKKDKDEDDVLQSFEPIPIYEQIERLLQYRLPQQHFAHRDIHVQSAPGGMGIQIVVDGQVFESVGDVTDLEIRSFIQAVIHEWESHQ